MKTISPTGGRYAPIRKTMRITHQMVRDLLDQLRDAGLDTQDICDSLALHQIQSNERAVRKWYSGKTRIRVVEYRALRDLLNEVKYED